MLFAAHTAQAYTIYSVGSVNVYTDNPYVGAIEDPVVVYAGLDVNNHSDRAMEIHWHVGIDVMKMVLNDRKRENWIKLLDKAIEWAAVAKENGVDHRQTIPFTCTNANYVKCTNQFVSMDGGQTSVIVFQLEDWDNQFIDAEDVILFDKDFEELKYLLTDGIDQQWEKQMQSKKTAGLFN